MKTSKWVWVSLLTGFTAIIFQCYFSLQEYRSESQTVYMYMASKDIELGQSIEAGDYKKIKVDLKDSKGGFMPMDEKSLNFKRASRRIPKGAIINSVDVKPSSNGVVKQAVSVKLAPENAYVGKLNIGEQVNLICYYQGELKTFEDLRIEDIQLEGQRLDGQWIYLSLSGEKEALENLVRCQNEGRIQIVKKISIHAT